MQLKLISRQLLFDEGSCFRECHASTIALLPDGRVAVAYFAGTREKSPDTAIWLSRQRPRGDGEPRTFEPGTFEPRTLEPHTFEPGTFEPRTFEPGTFEPRTFEPPRKIADTPDIPCWNPVLRCDGGKLILYFKSGHEIPAWRTLTTESDDLGDSFGEIRELVPGDVGGRGPVKNKCIVLHDRTLLAPASIETSERWDCFVDRFDGRDWQRGEFFPIDRSKLSGKGIIQPTLWEDDEHIVHALMRSTEGCIMRSSSSDGGVSWSPVEPTPLANNNSGIDCVRLDNGRVVLACNTASGNWAPRSTLALFVSDDNGKSWSEPYIVENEPPTPDTPPAEFSYPAIIAFGNRVLLSYTWKRRSIALCEFEII